MIPIKNPASLTLLGLPANASDAEYQTAFTANGGQLATRNAQAIAEALVALAMRERSLERGDAVAYCREKYPLLAAVLPSLAGSSVKRLVGLANELFATGAYADFESAYDAAKNRRPDLVTKMNAASARAKTFTPCAEKNLIALANERVARGEFSSTEEALAHVKLLQS